MKKYPFKFLDSYNQNDTDIFFGRDEEVAALYEMVFQNPILLLYGGSGTGKTSLIQCGLAGKFKSYEWMALTIRRGSNLNASLENTLIQAGGNDLDDEDAVSKEPGKKLSGLLRLIKGVYLNNFKPIYLIFDQFEELFVLGTKEEMEKFIQSVKEILRSEQPVKMIFSIREEYLGHLFEFEKEVPRLLRKKLRVEPMTLEKLGDVIRGINNFKLSNVRIKEDEVEAITQGIFERIKGKKKTLTIQLPYLQVFLDKLYMETTKDDSRQADALITLDVLNRIGDIGDVLRNFLEEQVKKISQKLSGSHKNVSPETIWKILSPFSTLEGTKEPISKKDLGERLPAIDKKLIDEAVELFVNSRILNFSENVNLYEIAHDSLALRIAEKRSDEEISLLEVRRLIKSQSALKEDAREYFTKKQLDFIEPYLQKLRLTDDEKELVDQSKMSHHRSESKKKARRRKISLSILTVTVLVIGVLTFFLVQASNAKNANRVLLTNQYWNQSRSKTGESDYAYALAHANMAFALSRDGDFKENILIELENQWPQVSLKNIFSNENMVAAASFTGDGKQLITISKDYRINTWDIETGEQTGTEKVLQPIEKDSPVMGFSPDGTKVFILTPGHNQNSIHVWDVKEARRLDPDASAMYAVSLMLKFNRDGTKFLAFGPDGLFHCYSLSNFLVEFSISARDAFFSPVSDEVLEVLDDGSLSVYNPVTQKGAVLFLHTKPGDQPANPGAKKKADNRIKYKGFVNTAVFSADGKRIVTANNDSTVRVWDAGTGQQIGDSMKHLVRVDEALFIEDDTRILSIDAENSTHVWNSRTAQVLGHAFKLEPGWTTPEFSENGKYVLTIINDVALVWEFVQENHAHHIDRVNEPSIQRVISPDLKKFGYQNQHNNSLIYQLYDLETRQQVGPDINSELRYFYEAEIFFGPGSRNFLTRFDNSNLKLWKADSANHVTLVSPAIPCASFSFGSPFFSSDGKTILVKDEQPAFMRAQLWNAETGNKIGTEFQFINSKKKNQLKDHDIDGKDILFPGLDPDLLPPDPVFSADNRLVLLFSKSGDTLHYHLINTVTGEKKWSGFQPFQVPVPELSPDGKWMLCYINDSTFKVVHSENGIQSWAPFRTHSKWFPVINPNGKSILVANSDSTAIFLDALTGNRTGNGIKKSVGWEFPPVFNKTGDRVITARTDQTFYLWNVETQQPIGNEFRFYLVPVFSPDGKLLLTTDYYGTARLFDTHTGKQKGPALVYSRSNIKKVIFSNDGKKVLIIYSKISETSEQEETTGIVWNVTNGKQVGKEIKDMVYNSEQDFLVDDIKFSDDAKWLKYRKLSGDVLLNTKAGDLDLPADLLALQILMATGYKYNFETNEKVVLSPGEFAIIKQQYNSLAQAHYTNCKYPEYNYWHRFNKAEARKARPREIPEYLTTGKYTVTVDASQFRVLPALQSPDTNFKVNNGSFLEPNQAILSKNQQYLLAYQADGDLVVYRKAGMVPIWSSQTDGQPANRLIMQFDGNLVIYTAGTKTLGELPIWSSGTYINNAGAYLRLEDNGNLVIYNTENAVVWESDSVDDFAD